jgi:hypothetical protein
MTHDEFWHWARMAVRDNAEEILFCLFLLASLWILRR